MAREILSLVKPNIATPVNSASASAFTESTLETQIESTALLSILEASLKSEKDKRIIGVLLGSRTDDLPAIKISDSFMLPYEKNGDEVSIDESHVKGALQLRRETTRSALEIVGWYQTSDTWDGFSSLLQEFFNSTNSKTTVSSNIFLTLQSKDSEGNAIAPVVNTYVTSPVGNSSITEGNVVLNPILFQITYGEAEKLALSYSVKNVESESSNSFQLDKSYNDLILIQNNFKKCIELLDANIEYVEKIISGELVVDDKADQIGKFLISNLLLFNSNSSNFNNKFNTFVQDALMIEYLVGTVKTQIELSARLISGA